MTDEVKEVEKKLPEGKVPVKKSQSKKSQSKKSQSEVPPGPVTDTLPVRSAAQWGKEKDVPVKFQMALFRFMDWLPDTMLSEKQFNSGWEGFENRSTGTKRLM